MFAVAVKPPLLASGAMAAALVPMNHLVSPTEPLAMLALAAPVSGMAYVAAWALMPSGRRQLTALARDFGGLLRSRAAWPVWSTPSGRRASS
jgi:hypothetical protein